MTVKTEPSPAADGGPPPIARHRPGTARAALAHRDFRIVFAGSFASNIGTWMQNVVLGAYALKLTGSPFFVSLITFAQLGPMLLLSIVGGALADLLDRRRLLLAAQAEQLVASVALALLVLAGDPPRGVLLVAVAAVGIGNALNAPVYTAVVPTLVARRDLPGAIALNSTQMNASRVVGPALGGLIYPWVGAAGVFLTNAATYVFVIAAVLLARVPKVEPDPTGARGWRRVAGGLIVAREDALVRRCLVTIAVFSFLCLPFIGQMPTVASFNLGIDPQSTAYGLLYAAFGCGAVLGAASIGTVLAGVERTRLVRMALLAFAALLATFAALRHPAPAYPVALLVGFAYFAAVTSLSTVLQEHVPDALRGRVMALWIMGFGGTVPLGLLVAGPIIELTSVTAVMLYGVVAAIALARYADLRSAAERARQGPLAVDRAA